MKNFSATDLLIFTKQLSVMLKAGIPIESSLASLSTSTSNKSLTLIYKKIQSHLVSGHSLHDSLAIFPHHFDPMYLALIQIGEKTGTLDQVLYQLVGDIDKLHRLKQKIRSALMYPATVIGVMIITTTLLALFVLPKLVEFFAAFDQVLPLPTQILIALSIFARDYGVVTATLTVVLIILSIILSRFPGPKLALDRFSLATPYLGSFLIQSQTASLARNLSLMLRSGMPVSLALFTLTTTTTNLVIARQIQLMLDGITSGKALSATLNKHGQIFPPLFRKMVEVGEQTGSLAELLSETADFFENEVDTIAKNSTTAIEPILLLIVGLLVGFMALAIISPIYQLTGSIGQ